MGLRDNYLAATQGKPKAQQTAVARCAPIALQHATNTSSDATRGATTTQQPADLHREESATRDATTAQRTPATDATNVSASRCALYLPSAPMSAEEERAIRRWLAHIEEHDPELIVYTIDQCRIDPDKRAYFLRRSREAPATVVEVEHVTSSCMTCEHRRGHHDLHWGCVAREDLPLLYGEGHPLRALPDDLGAGCKTFESLARRGRVRH